MVSESFLWLEYIGTIVFALTGALAAIESEMDIMGVVFIAFFVGNGGGTIRDLCLGATPVFWIAHPTYIITTLITGIATFLYFSLRKISCFPFTRSLIIADALGVGVFAIAGAQKAMQLHQGFLVAVVMGLITAVGGGIIRDIVCDRIPQVFNKEVYALAAVIGSALYLLFADVFSVFNASLMSIVLVIVLRYLSVRYNWHLPKIKRQHDY